MNFKSLNKSLNKLIATIFSIFFIFFIFWIFLFSLNGQDGNILIRNIFFDWIFSKQQILKILKMLAPLLLGSLAVLLCYKSGIINLSVIGQMSLSGLVIFFVGLKLKEYNSEVNWLPLLVLVGILAAVSLSVLIFILKIYFNINEVLSSIFLNFVVMYFFRFLVKRPNILDPNDKLSTKDSLGFMIQFNFSVFEIIPISLIFSFFIFVFIGYILLRTRYGLKLKLINKYKKSAKYVGLNYKRNIFKIFIISGIISGLAGLFYYFKNDNSKLFLSDALPNNGFDTIIIVWLSQYSVVGLPFIAFFISLIRTQQEVIPISHISPEILQIIIGTILLFIPFISQLFFNKKQKQKMKETFIKLKLIFNKERFIKK